MPSMRRMRLLAVAVIVTVVILFFYSGGDPNQESHNIQDFYRKTMEGMKKGSPPGQAVINSQTGQKAGHIPADKDADGDVDEDDKKAAAEMQVRLKQAEQKAKDNANTKGGLKPDIPSDIVGKGNAAGQVKEKPLSSGGQAASKKSDKSASKKSKDKSDLEDSNSKEEMDMAELKSILKKAPVVIFSKTHCPFSKRAKGVLLDKYSITPEPHVVELDKHPNGPGIQAALAKLTGRKTVPNVLVNGESIGGGDEVVDLDHQDKLSDKIKRLGNKRVQVSERFKPGSNNL